MIVTGFGNFVRSAEEKKLPTSKLGAFAPDPQRRPQPLDILHRQLISIYHRKGTMNNIEDSDFLENLKRSRPADSQNEKAYRRGVHQALFMISEHLQEIDNLNLYKWNMREVTRIAGEMRRERKEIPHFLHELIEKLNQSSKR